MPRSADKKPRKSSCRKGTPAPTALDCAAKGLLAGNKRKNGERCCGKDRKRPPSKALTKKMAVHACNVAIAKKLADMPSKKRKATYAEAARLGRGMRTKKPRIAYSP